MCDIFLKGMSHTNQQAAFNLSLQDGNSGSRITKCIKSLKLGNINISRYVYRFFWHWVYRHTWTIESLSCIWTNWCSWNQKTKWTHWSNKRKHRNDKVPQVLLYWNSVDFNITRSPRKVGGWGAGALFMCVHHLHSVRSITYKYNVLYPSVRIIFSPKSLMLKRKRSYSWWTHTIISFIFNFHS